MIKLSIIGIGNIGSAHGNTVLSGAVELREQLQGRRGVPVGDGVHQGHSLLLARQAQAMAPEYTNLHRDIRACLEGKSPPTPAPADHAIVSKIIIQAGEVFSLSASSDQRPLVYERRAEPDWTRAFQETGLHGLLTAVARQIHRGTLRTRADSRLTRALRKALHAMGLENFQAMAEEEAVRQLVRLAEEALGQ